MNPHRLLNEVGANYSAYRIRSFVGVLTRHLMEPNKYAMGSCSYVHQDLIPLHSALSEQVTFHLQPRKQLHALTPINANFTILSAVTYIYVSAPECRDIVLEA